MPGTDDKHDIRQQQERLFEQEQNLAELEPWSKKYATEIALKEGIQLTDEHWDIICFLRDRYIQNGQASSGRHVVEALERRYAVKGGKRYLYSLFPHGPVAQGSRIAGLPLPAHTVDRGFGSSE